MAVMMRALLIPLFLVMAAVSPACGEPPTSKAPAGGDPDTKGALVFNANCVLCHGRNGDLGMGGAKDLTLSMLSREEMIAIVTNGKGAMMPYRNVLTPKQIEQVVDHARTLRQAK
jgi:cytochrome c6